MIISGACFCVIVKKTVNNYVNNDIKMFITQKFYQLNLLN